MAHNLKRDKSFVSIVCNKVPRRALFIICSTAILLGPATSLAQTCSSPNIDPTTVLQKALETNDRKLVFRIAAVADEHAVPVLQKIAKLESDDRYSVPMAARIALAKLGGEKEMATLESQLREHKCCSTGGTIEDIGLVGNERDVRTLMEFFVEHFSDPDMVHDFGDYGEDLRSEVIKAVRQISLRREVVDLPPWNSERPWTGYLQLWKKWWEGHKAGQVTFAAYETVTDPVMRCFAREVDWGFPDPILEMTDRFGEAAEPVLRKFPRTSAASDLGSVEGNLEAALAKLGDEKEFLRIKTELESEDSGYAVSKLAFIGGKQAFVLLISILGTPDKAVEREKLKMDECVQYFSKRYSERKAKKLATPFCNGMYDLKLQEYENNQSAIMRALSEMLGHPPLPADAQPTSENINKWKDWWAKNKDTVQFIKPPVKSYE